MNFPPEVERWRPTVERYFPAELVDKALWTIQHESAGNPAAAGDGGVARGLFQIQDNRNFANRPDAAWLDNPENNIKYAAQQLGAANGNFSAWGEGATHEGKPFGAFGNNTYPGGSMDGNQPYTPLGDGSGGFDVDPQYKAMQDAVRDAYTAWRAAAQGMDPTKARALPEYRAFILAQMDLEEFESLPSAGGSSSKNAAQQGFENAIDLGDYRLNAGKAAYDRWSDKFEKASQAARDQIGAVYDENEETRAQQQAREASAMPGLMRRASGRRLAAPDYSDALERWKGKYGVGAEPGLYGDAPPGSTAGTGAAGGGAAATAKPPAPQGSMGWQGPLNPDDPRGVLQIPASGAGLKPAATGGMPHFAGQTATEGDWRLPRDPSVWDKIGGMRNDAGDPTLFGSTLDRWGEAPGNLARNALVPPGFLPIAAGASTAVKAGKGIKGKVSRWWQKGGLAQYAKGTPPEGHPGGPALVGERGAEFVNVPGMGQMQVDSPQVLNLPAGTDVIPADEMYQLQRMRKMAAAGPAKDPQQQMAEQAARRNDPDLQAKVMESMKKAMAGQIAMNPGPTPTLEPGVRDRWAPMRSLTGIPAYAPVQQEAK